MDATERAREWLFTPRPESDETESLAELLQRVERDALLRVGAFIGQRFKEREPHTGAWDTQLIYVLEVLQEKADGR